MFYLCVLYLFTYTGVQHDFHIRLVSFNSNTTGVTCGAGTANRSGAPEFIPVFNGVRVARSLVFFVMLCRSLFVLLSIFIFSHCIVCPFDLRLSITPLVSSKISYYRFHRQITGKQTIVRLKPFICLCGSIVTTVLIYCPVKTVHMSLWFNCDHYSKLLSGQNSPYVPVVQLWPLFLTIV